MKENVRTAENTGNFLQTDPPGLFEQPKLWAK